MKTNLFQHTVRWVLATVCLSMMVESSPAGSFAQQCAVRDMQVLMSIEERQSASATSADKVSDAIFALVNARIVCQEGNVVDAMSIYEASPPFWLGRVETTGFLGRLPANSNGIE